MPAGLHLWSTTVQVHAYVLLPLALVLLRPRSPGFRPSLAAALAAAAVGGSLWRLRMASTVDLRFPFSGVPGGEAVAGRLGCPGSGRTLACMMHAWQGQGAELPVHKKEGQTGMSLCLLCLQWLQAMPHLLVQGLPGTDRSKVQLLVHSMIPSRRCKLDRPSGGPVVDPRRQGLCAGVWRHAGPAAALTRSAAVAAGQVGERVGGWMGAIVDGLQCCTS